jgi:hypothetical protein
VWLPGLSGSVLWLERTHMLIRSQPGNCLRVRQSPSHSGDHCSLGLLRLSASTITPHTRCTMKAKRHAVTLAAMVMVVGCQIPPPPSPSSPPQPTPMSLTEMRVSQQLIIKFKSDTMACDAGGIASLSSATQVPLRHVRPMSPDTCVVQQFADHAEGLSHEQERLKQHPAIEWLEEDRKMHTHF